MTSKEIIESEAGNTDCIRLYRERLDDSCRLHTWWNLMEMIARCAGGHHNRCG